ncbi:MAG TPA: hypothetical protein VJ771_03595 [Candidatus Nitrosotalea sp.]|nr:hypothetical protein [Candidatus Nitrosotalea sp.]
MPDIDVTIRDISELVSAIISNAHVRRRISNNSAPTSLIGIRVNISTNTLEELFSNTRVEKPYPNYQRNDPLVDVIEDGNKIRVIASLPGIRKEDVWFEARKNMLVIEISKHGRLYRKEILCDARVNQISVKSHTLNNSVLEIVFDKA